MKVLIVSADHKERADFLGRIDLPKNYMGDFSIMGFGVGNLKEAETVLKAQGYEVETINGVTALGISGRNDLPRILALLRKSGVYCEYGDIVDTLYQA